jgi:hypothetical protein
VILTFDDIGGVGPGFVELGYQFNPNWAVIDPRIGSPYTSARSGEYAALDDYPNANGAAQYKYTVKPGDNIADLQISGLNLNGGVTVV